MERNLCDSSETAVMMMEVNEGWRSCKKDEKSGFCPCQFTEALAFLVWAQAYDPWREARLSGVLNIFLETKKIDTDNVSLIFSFFGR